MNKHFETLKKFFKVIELSKTIEIECPVCHNRYSLKKSKFQIQDKAQKKGQF